MKSLEEIYYANGQNPELAYKSGKLEYDDRYGCMVWIPAEFLVKEELAIIKTESSEYIYSQSLGISDLVT